MIRTCCQSSRVLKFIKFRDHRGNFLGRLPYKEMANIRITKLYVCVIFNLKFYAWYHKTSLKSSLLHPDGQCSFSYTFLSYRFCFSLFLKHISALWSQALIKPFVLDTFERTPIKSCLFWRFNTDLIEMYKYSGFRL